MTDTSVSDLIPIDGVIAAAVVLVAGILLTLYFANRATEEPPVSFLEMARPVVRGAVALTGLVIVAAPFVMWLVAAVIVSDDGCAKALWMEGCLPG